MAPVSVSGAGLNQSLPRYEVCPEVRIWQVSQIADSFLQGRLPIQHYRKGYGSALHHRYADEKTAAVSCDIWGRSSRNRAIQCPNVELIGSEITGGQFAARDIHAAVLSALVLVQTQHIVNLQRVLFNIEADKQMRRNALLQVQTNWLNGTARIVVSRSRNGRRADSRWTDDASITVQVLEAIPARL
jgi:hypothetical protein